MRHSFLPFLVSVLLPFNLPAEDPNDWNAERFSVLFTNVASQAMRCVVKIASAKKKENPEESCQKNSLKGSGFLVSPDGYILTSAHIVEKSSYISVYCGNKEAEADLIWSNLEEDLAVLKIDGRNLPYLNLGNSDTVRVGEWVIAIGSPFGMQPFASKGIVGAKNPSGTLLFTDVLLNPGNSGGPLLNLRGEVIGIINAVMLSDQVLQGIGIVTAINHLKAIMLTSLIPKNHSIQD